MTANEIAQEAVRLPLEERKRIIARLVMANMRDDKEEWDELQRRLDDGDPKSWMSIEEVKARLLAPERT